MEGFEQTPPDGLWEAVEAGLPGRKAAAFPWMWALAGVAAALLAVVLLWRPDGAIMPGREAAVLTSAETDVDGATSVSPAEVAVEAADSSAETDVEVVTSVSPAEVAAEEADSSAETDVEIAPSVSPAEVVPAEPSPAEISPVEAAPAVQQIEIRTPKRRHSSYTASLIAGSLPGSASITTNGYGINTPSGRSGMFMAPLLGRNKPSETQKRFSVAMRVGAMFNWSFSEHWGVESGLQLTNLQTQVKEITGNITSVNDKTIAYLGVPVLAVWTPLRYERFSLYASAGPMFEYGFRSFGVERTYIGEELTGQAPFKNKESDFILSLGVNVGAQWAVSSVGAIFVQPGLSWHMAGEGNTESYYTAHPLSLAVTAGFRFGF